MYSQAKYDEQLIFETDGKRSLKLIYDKEYDLKIPDELLRKSLNFPDHSEIEVVRHYTRLSQMNFAVDINPYPLGSCTMKYNPKYSEELAKSDKVLYTHPFQDPSTIQGSLQIMYELQEYLKDLGGMDEVTLQPAAGAQGEFTGLLLIRAYYKHSGKIDERREIIIPDSAHGTNPASATMAGFDVVELESNERGMIDLDALKSAVSDKTAALMITNHNTLAIFEANILDIAMVVHSVGALLYYDGANLNAIMGKTTPGKMGFDVVHFNLHKTFSTPHGGGGPGAGPVGVTKKFADFLPVPIIRKNDKGYYLDYSIRNTIGKVAGYFGNFGVLLRAWTYIKYHGGEGLKEVSELAVLNSNYLKEKLKPYFEVPYEDLKKHEFVMSGNTLKKYGLRTLDFAKRLLDYGVHAPTIYFPLIVEEALMIEPTETEVVENLDHYASIVDKIFKEAEENQDLIRSAPHNTAVRRIDEVEATKKPILTWKMFRDKPL